MTAPKFNPPPNWPAPPENWTPPPGWQPDPAWGPLPAGWQLWTTEKSNANWFVRHKVLAGVGAFLLLGTIAGALAQDGETAATGSAAAETSQGPSEAERAAAEEQARAEEAAKAEAERAEAEQRAEAERVEAEQRAEAERVAAEARAAEEAAKMNPASYAELSSRDYALIAKDPDAHAGGRYVIYGNITQFDSATGPDAFLARTDAQRHNEWYEYETNTLVVAEDASILAPVVEDDLVKMYVEVVGSFSYDTQIGGNTTVPQVTVRMIEVIGSSA